MSFRAIAPSWNELETGCVRGDPRVISLDLGWDHAPPLLGPPRLVGVKQRLQLNPGHTHGPRGRRRAAGRRGEGDPQPPEDARREPEALYWEQVRSEALRRFLQGPFLEPLAWVIFQGEGRGLRFGSLAEVVAEPPDSPRSVKLPVVRLPLHRVHPAQVVGAELDQLEQQLVGSAAVRERGRQIRREQPLGVAQPGQPPAAGSGS